MAKIYNVSSSAKVEQLETELAKQLQALRVEIEENGVLQGTPSNSYCSTPIPKDVSYFRVERMQALQRGLQVSSAQPVMSQAEIAQREIESCLGWEYTPESLPLLLHQFYADQTYQLAQSKYQLMLRWTRFCRHSAVLEKLYPLYKAQITHLTNQFEDSVQRARRLAVAKERVLSGAGNPVSVITQEDVIIYLQWLICHLHSVNAIHNFLHVLHYIPASKMKETDTSLGRMTAQHITTAEVPLHSTRLEDYRAQLQHLLTHFHIKFNTDTIQSPADEVDLFSMVSQKFKTVFRSQEKRKAHLQYDSTEAVNQKVERKNPDMTLKKESNWIPYIQVKPKRDPWQQKTMAKLKQQGNMDELLHLLSKFQDESDISRVNEALIRHLSFICEEEPLRPLSLSPQPTAAQTTSYIWRSIFCTGSLSQVKHFPLQESNAKACDISMQKRGKGAEKTDMGSHYISSTQLLGLDEDVEDGAKDNAMARGAYMSLLYLRHLRIRELRHICLTLVNYMRSVERSVTFDTAGLRRVGGDLLSSAEETGWMSAARGGMGPSGGLGSHHYIHNTPADYKVHCSEFMEFPEVENFHDFYTTEGSCIHTQDQCGQYVLYDVALRDLEELEETLLLIASHYIHRTQVRGKSNGSYTSASAIHSWVRTEVDRLAVLLDIWTCEAAFLEHKIQLLNCYFEAYQHVTHPEERFGLAQVITDIMHRRPQLDLETGYFAQAYKEEMVCLQSHQQLIKAVCNSQIDHQRQYLQRIWRGKQEGTPLEYGFPPNYVPKHLVSVGGSSPALQSVFLLEVHPSLGQAWLVHQALGQAHSELCRLHRARAAPHRVLLEQQLLQLALHHWLTLAPAGTSYSAQTQRDLFSDVFFDDPVLVRDVGLAVVRSAEEQERRQGRERQQFVVETFSVLLELVSLRHRLMHSASETQHLAQLYKALAQEMGFDEHHVYIRPMQFEFAVQQDRPEQCPVFVTALLQDSSSVDRFLPASLPLAIQELDENQIGKFSFRTEEAVVQLMNQSSLENLQVTLACQVTQKNALTGAVKQASLCYWVENLTSVPELGEDSRGSQKQSEDSSTPGRGHHVPHPRDRLARAFVSIQLEKVVPRDEMLNSFIKKKEVMTTVMTSPDEVAKIKRKLILEFCHKYALSAEKFSGRVMQSCVRGQIVALGHSLTSLLNELPDIQQAHFVIGQANETKSDLDTAQGLQTDPRRFQCRPRRLLSPDGKTLLNLWFIPHYTEVVIMFKTLEETESNKALQQTLGIVSALHDIVYYLVSFARLGNPDTPGSSAGHRLTADWGGAESIGAELREVQQQVDSLPDPGSPAAVARLLQLRREGLLLRFEAAVRYMIRDAFLSSGNIASYQTVRDNMRHALPVLSDSLRVHWPHLPLPQPLEPSCLWTQRMYPWRTFLSRHGLHPLHIWDILPIEHCMQMCLSGLDDRSRMEANGAILGVSLLVDDVLSSGGGAMPLQLRCKGHTGHTADTHGKASKANDTKDAEEASEKMLVPPTRQDPIKDMITVRGFLLLWKQLEIFKESWARQQLGVEEVNTVSLYKHFSRLYRMEIHSPSMQGLAQHMGREQEHEAWLSDQQPLLTPVGASEVDGKTWQLLKLLESTECDMIRAVQRRLAGELTLVLSERARQSTGLPTELWKSASIKHCFSPERPQIVEHFIQNLMECGEESGEQVVFSRAHLQDCLTRLGCDVMRRERSCFLLYSQFYEQILQQQNQLLYHREQDVKELEEAMMQKNHPQLKAAELCHGLMTEVTALRARLSQLEEEQGGLQLQLSLEQKQRYDALVRQLFSACIQLKSSLDEYHIKMDQDVIKLVGKVRQEGVDKIIKLKNRFGSTKDHEAQAETLSKKEVLQDLYAETSQLAGLLSKARALGCWRQAVVQGKLHRELQQWKQREMAYKMEGLKVRMTSEEEVTILKHELNAARDAMMQSTAEFEQIQRKVDKQTQRLQEVEHHSAQEARSRRDLESSRMLSLEQLQEDVGDKERQLRTLSAQLERSSMDNQLQRQRSHKKIKQVRGQLHQERSLKLEAFQQVDKLQGQIHIFEKALSKTSTSSGRTKTASSWRATSIHPSADVARKRLPTAPVLSGFTGVRTAEGPHNQPSQEDTEALLDRPRTSPRRLRVETTKAQSAAGTDGGSSYDHTTYQYLSPANQ